MNDQAWYDASPELQELLARAMVSPVSTRPRIRKPLIDGE